MAQLKLLKKKRTSLQLQLARFNNFVEAFDIDSRTDIADLELQSRLDKVCVLFSDFDDVQNDIENLAQADDAEREIFEDLYYKATAKAKSYLNNGRSAAQDATVSNPGLTNTCASIKLPTLNLPTFSGAFDEWSHFHDSFIGMIHNNSSLTNTQKFYYLTKSLQRDALQVIESIDITDVNYAIAWDLLKERFGNKRIIINSHLKAIFAMPSLAKESATGLRQLSDNLIKHVRALTSLGQPTEHWDSILIHVVSSRLDSVSLRDWQSSITHLGDNLPTLADLKRFLITRCEILESLSNNVNSKPNNTNNVNVKANTKSNYPRNSQSYTVIETKRCQFCRGDHSIQACSDFLKLNVNERFNHAKTQKWCINCLYAGHYTSQCKGSSCRKCNKRHNTLLHVENGVPPVASQQRSSTEIPVEPQGSVQSSLIAIQQPQVEMNVALHTSGAITSKITLLPTAVVRVYDCEGKTHRARLLLDSGSQSNFVTCKLFEKLGLESHPLHLSVSGINHSLSTIDKRVKIQFESTISNYKARISCLVIPNIAQSVPTDTFDSTMLNIPSDLCLADPEFNEGSEIDMLLGAELFWQLICQGQVRLGHNLPILQKTLLGWVVSGPVLSSNVSLTQNYLIQHDISNIALDEQLTKFWTLEEVPDLSSNALGNNLCEKHFRQTFNRSETGRFVVELPFVDNFSLGESFDMALQRYNWLERKLLKNPDLKLKYCEFINEYITSGHMSPLLGDVDLSNGYYLPHHAVLKDSSATTKLRVVFDASAKSSNSRSLNDNLLVGPVVQSELLSILLRFRKHRFVVTADVAKMYRQILITPEHRKYQRILWRSDLNAPIQTYELNTVTYGTGPAPYLATRCILQLSLETEHTFPNASRALAEDFYVDDFISGDDSEAKLIELQNDVNRILLSAGMQLRKWSSNSQTVLDSLAGIEYDSDIHFFNSDDEIKTLGLFWNTRFDSFCYVIPKPSLNIVTKRSILSSVSRIFDPLGLLAPVIITVKLLIQSLWSLKLSWDEALPLHIHTLWSQLQEELSCLNPLRINRYILTPHYATIEMHGFSDASQVAYGACIYIKSYNKSGDSHVALVCAKSRVAPLKSLTIPRLELCAATLLSNLVKSTLTSLQLQPNNIYLWTDSQIVLAWIRGCPSRWKVYVANRVIEIQNLTSKDNWHYVHTSQNPADLISRGEKPTKLLNSNLWWNGPSWLQGEPQQYPVNLLRSATSTEIPEQKTITATTAFKITVTEPIFVFINYSSWPRLKRTCAFVLRFINNCQSSKIKRSGILTCNELAEAELTIIKLLQAEAFSDVIAHLKGTGLAANNRLLTLSPFLDNLGLIRVGGRLRNSNLSYNKMHPLLLPNKHHVTKLIITYEHIRLLHAGPAAVLSSVRERFWPVNGRNMTRQITRTCVRCFRAAPSPTFVPIMGDLPEGRVQPARPFERCGVDYAGPFLIKDRKLRGSKLIKSYLSLFVCFASKAVHLELVTDLSTQSFVAALRRFISRRGKPAEIHSDNGTNFVGAQREIGKFLSTELTEIENQSSKEGISWHFIPPRSPHFGGLWEAAVKTVKHHLKRIVADASLTYEEFNTIIIQIEACMNSRPLLPLSTDPSDLNPLTPAHFLIGTALTTVPESSFVESKENLLSRYQRTQRIYQTFWKRWSKDYLNELQTRSKWRSQQGDCPRINDVVLLIDDNLPPLRWRLGRIIELHKGQDNIARVATVQTSTGPLRRAFAKLCPLPRLEANP